MHPAVTHPPCTSSGDAYDERNVVAVTKPTSLLKILGLSFGLAVTVGNTIGGGILRTPGDIATWLPNPWLFVGVWIVGGLYALLGANALSELGTMIPRSAGQYVFAQRAFGPYAGFLVGWIDWISTGASTAAISIVVGESLASATGISAGSSTPIAAAIVTVFTILLARGTKLGDRAQRVTSLTKALALLALVAACFVFRGRATIPPDALPAAGAARPATFVAILLALQAVIYTYDGWSGPIYFSEELDDPGRQIPQSMFYGLLSVAVIYLLINVAFVAALPTVALAGSPLAAATVAHAIFGGRGELLVRIVVIVSLPSAINACLLMASRVLYSMSRDGLGVKTATQVNTGGTPVVALFASGAVALAFLATGTFNTIIAIAAFFFVASYTLSFAAVFVLRRRDPSAARPYRAKGHPWTTGLVLLGSLGFLVSAVVADPRNSAFALGIVFVSYPVFRLSVGGGIAFEASG
jgi:basic amino acid/polyamine antiporter, APA family